MISHGDFFAATGSDDAGSLQAVDNPPGIVDEGFMQ